MTMNVSINVRPKKQQCGQNRGDWLVTLRRALPERGGAVGLAQLVNDPCISWWAGEKKNKKVYSMKRQRGGRALWQSDG